jgi:uncharacterized protein YjbJ (UPF0337 family)
MSNLMHNDSVKLTVVPSDTPIIPHIDTNIEAGTLSGNVTAGGTNHTIPGKQPIGNWNLQKGKLKAKFPQLTEADLHYDNGKKDEMLARIHTKIGKTKEELDAIILGL